MQSSNTTKYTVFAVAAVVGVAAATAAYMYLKSGNEEALPQENKEPEQEPVIAENDTPITGRYKSRSKNAASADQSGDFVDPNYDKNQFISKAAAYTRSQSVSEVSYLIAVALLKGGKTFHGKV
jgi:hypothetical protein